MYIFDTYNKFRKISSKEEDFKNITFYVCKTESESEVAQSRPTLCDPMDCSLPGSSLHGILQARVLEWVSISYVCKDETKKLA